ncbi:MAG TPA: hypothetical protein DCW44_04855 [Eubacterium sp.]|nr:hypothetical protein [Eubacterium sp.]
MKKTISRICAICAIVAPFIATQIMIRIEPEYEEAIEGGVIVGCFIGSILGVIALLTNKHDSKWIKVLSILPMIPTVAFATLVVLQNLYGPHAFVLIK